jgi:acyl-CoA thioester hydrolase
VYAELEKVGTLLPVVQLNLTYKRPARYDQLLEVHTVVAESPTSKMRLLCEVRHGQELLVKGEVVLVFVDAREGRPCRPPVGLVERIAELGLIVDQ